MRENGLSILPNALISVFFLQKTC